MKVRSLLVSMLCMLALSVSFASCSDDDDLLDDSGSTVALPQVRAFFLNAGTQGANNANIAFYAPNGGADFRKLSISTTDIKNGKAVRTISSPLATRN